MKVRNILALQGHVRSQLQRQQHVAVIVCGFHQILSFWNKICTMEQAYCQYHPCIHCDNWLVQRRCPWLNQRPSLTRYRREIPPPRRISSNRTLPGRSRLALPPKKCGRCMSVACSQVLFDWCFFRVCLKLKKWCTAKKWWFPYKFMTIIGWSVGITISVWTTPYF